MVDLLDDSPFLFDDQAAQSLFDRQSELARRVETLRSERLSDEVLKNYYGEKRFEEVAESNALEGSPLTVGETTLAVQAGVTISGHDPAFSRDARTLHAALEQLTEMVLRGPTDVEQLQEIHGLILGDRPGAGIFRREPISISGSQHKPPGSWAEVMAQMEEWESWSRERPTAPALLRAALLHAWLTQVHPYIDGNGRAARAILNLELIRSGFPRIIIRRKDRERYLDALHHADDGDLGHLLDLVLTRTNDALLDLERVAKRIDNYDPIDVELRKARERHAAIFNDAVGLLVNMLEDTTVRLMGSDVSVLIKRYEGLEADDLRSLLKEDSTGNRWSWQIDCAAPGLARVSFLAWVGFRSDSMCAALPNEHKRGPSIFWSVPNPQGAYPPWVIAGRNSPGVEEMTVLLPDADHWFIRNGQSINRVRPSTLADRLANGLRDRLRERLAAG